MKIEVKLRTPFVLNVVVLVLSLTGTPGEKRPEFGCFNIGTVMELQFRQSGVYRHLYTFGSRKAAEAARSATGIAVEKDGRVWTI